MARGKSTKPKGYSTEQAKTVMAMAQYGVPLDDIAAVIGMCDDTMLKIYKNEIAKGRAAANAKIGKRLFEKAMDGDTTALIFWAKCRMRWKSEDKKAEMEESVVPPPVINVQIVDGRISSNAD